MNKVIGSRVDLNDDNNKYAVEFRTYIEDLFDNDTVQKLDRFTQHFHTSRLQHILNVSYYSYRIAKVIGCDCRAAARAGLLHDLFWYDWRNKKTPQMHAFLHPRLALKNASKITELSSREEDAILKHMWPLYRGIPKYKESYAVTLADKYAATLEIGYQWSNTAAKKIVSLVSSII